MKGEGRKENCYEKKGVKKGDLLKTTGKRYPLPSRKRGNRQGVLLGRRERPSLEERPGGEFKFVCLSGKGESRPTTSPIFNEKKRQKEKRKAVRPLYKSLLRRGGEKSGLPDARRKKEIPPVPREGRNTPSVREGEPIVRREKGGAFRYKGVGKILRRQGRTSRSDEGRKIFTSLIGRKKIQRLASFRGKKKRGVQRFSAGGEKEVDDFHQLMRRKKDLPLLPQEVWEKPNKR